MEERFKTAVCADIMFIKKENGVEKVLLSKRMNTGFDDGYYELPGGHLEDNEDIFDAVIREIKEELLVDIKRNDIKLIHIMHHYSKKRINFIFSSDVSIDPKIGEPDKCSSIDWFDINNLPNNITDKVKIIIDNIKNDKLYDYM